VGGIKRITDSLAAVVRPTRGLRLEEVVLQPGEHEIDGYAGVLGGVVLLHLDFPAQDRARQGLETVPEGVAKEVRECDAGVDDRRM
jgi:hypothetical protein